MEKTRVLLADADPRLTGTLAGYIDRRDDMCAVGRISDGGALLNEVYTKMPDVIVMELILPRRDGFTVLEDLRGLNEDARPKVIIVTGLARDEFILRAMNLGAAYYMVKPFDMRLLCDRVAEVAGIPKAEPAPEPIPSETKDDMVTNLFLTLGMPAHIKGYAYLREAVRMVIDDHTLLGRITKELYPGIASRFLTTSSKVERAMRHAIEVAWNRGRLETANSMYGYRIFEKQDKPSNGEFIAIVADKVGQRQTA